MRTPSPGIACYILYILSNIMIWFLTLQIPQQCILIIQPIKRNTVKCNKPSSAALYSMSWHIWYHRVCYKHLLCETAFPRISRRCEWKTIWQINIQLMYLPLFTVCHCDACDIAQNQIPFSLVLQVMSYHIWYHWLLAIYLISPMYQIPYKVKDPFLVDLGDVNWTKKDTLCLAYQLSATSVAWTLWLKRHTSYDVRPCVP